MTVKVKVHAFLVCENLEDAQAFYDILAQVDWDELTLDEKERRVDWTGDESRVYPIIEALSSADRTTLLAGPAIEE